MTADVDAVTARERAWVEALLAGDIAALESLLSPRFLLVGVRSTGTEPIGRDAWFATLGAMRFHAMAIDRVEVSLFGDCAWPASTAKGRSISTAGGSTSGFC